MVKRMAQIFGIVFVLVGILGFIPGVTNMDKQLLLGIFKVDTVHNIVHLLSGIVALWAASNAKNAKMYFQIFGVIYALVAILGFFTADGDKVLGLIINNPADTWLHVVIAVVALYFGFVAADEK